MEVTILTLCQLCSTYEKLFLVYYWNSKFYFADVLRWNLNSIKS